MSRVISTMENEDLAIRSHAIAITILFSYSKRGWSRGAGIMGGPMLFNVFLKIIAF